MFMEIHGTKFGYFSFAKAEFKFLTIVSFIIN